MIRAHYRQLNFVYDMVEPPAPIFLYIQQINIILSKRFSKRAHKGDRVNALFGIQGPARPPAKLFQPYSLERSKPAVQGKKSNRDARISFVFAGFTQCRDVESRIDAIFQETARVIPRPVVSVGFQIALSGLPLYPSEKPFEGATAKQHCYVHNHSFDRDRRSSTPVVTSLSTRSFPYMIIHPCAYSAPPRPQVAHQSPRWSKLFFRRQRLSKSPVSREGTVSQPGTS